jgi:hypothetical protein
MEVPHSQTGNTRPLARQLKYNTRRKIMALITVHVTIEGIAPLIVNRFHEEAQEEATSGVHARRERPGPEEDATMRLYPQNGHGNTIPAENLRQSVIVAAGRTKLGRRAATTDTAAAVYIFPEMLDLQGEWHVDSRAVVIPATKGRILRHRPMFNTWSVEFDMQINIDLIPERTVKEILSNAGALVGLGDFRPARKGPYGRFQITSWEIAR